MKIAKIVFQSSPTRPYSYLCGNLAPVPGQEVVVPVGADASLKIVKCVEVVDSTPDDLRYALKTLYGIVVTQPKEPA